MTIKDYSCKNCSGIDFFIKRKSIHNGLYCTYCGRWLKWADKEDLILTERGNQHEHLKD